MNFIKQYGLSIAFVAIASGFFLSLYCPGAIIFAWLLALIFMSAVTFLFIDKLCNGKKKGGLIYLAAMAVILVVLQVFLKLGGDVAEFLKWLFCGVSPHNFWFRAFIALASAFFVSSVVYYFTRVLSRSFIIFFVMMIPFAVYGKVNADFPIFWLIILSAAFFAVCAAGSFPKNSNKPRLHATPGFFAAVSLFGIAAALLAWASPRPIIAPYREEFDKFTERVTFGIPAGDADFTDFTGASGINNGNNRPSDKVLYEIEADEAFYLRTQSFDVYNPSGWGSIKREPYESGWNHWESYCYNLSEKKLMDSLKWAAENRPEIFTLEEKSLISELSTNETERVYTVHPMIEKSFRVLFSHENQTDYDYIGRKFGKDIYRTRRNEYFMNGKNYLAGGTWYQGTYYKDHFSEDMARSLTYERFSEILSDILESENELPYENLNILNAWKKDFDEAMEYKKDTAEYDYDGRELIAALSEEITAGCTNEYEKAKAIEGYFYNGDFVYDMNFAPRESGAEYFLLESKRGICSDFATAMTLLARESGLAARYTEGAKMEPIDGTPGKFAVTPAGSHAFPEIYIPGNGWTIFEPTIPQKGFWNMFWDENKQWVLFGGSLFLVLVLLFIFRRAISEGIFLMRLIGAPEKKSVSLMFLRLCRLAERSAGVKRDKITAGALSAVLSAKYGVDSSDFVKVFEKAVYGEKPMESGDFKKAYNCYRLCRKTMLKKKK